jgi:hypothetical protein
MPWLATKDARIRRSSRGVVLRAVRDRLLKPRVVATRGHADRCLVVLGFVDIGVTPLVRMLKRLSTESRNSKVPRSALNIMTDLVALVPPVMGPHVCTFTPGR